MGLTLELLESFGLLFCLILAAPLGLFRRIDRLSETLRFLPSLLKRRLFASILRTRLDYKMGNHQQAVVGLGPIVAQLERDIDLASNVRLRKLLCSLYCDMQQLYLLSGQVGQAVAVVIRAHKILGLDRLPTNPDLDIKAAHVVKAGLAATKLLEDGGLATLMVRQGEEPVLSRPPFSVPQRQTSEPKRAKAKRSEDGATIIPFPRFQP